MLLWDQFYFNYENYNILNNTIKFNKLWKRNFKNLKFLIEYYIYFLYKFVRPII